MTHVTTFYNTAINRNEVICVEYGFNVSYLIMLRLQKFRAVTQSDFKSLSYMTEFFIHSIFQIFMACPKLTEIQKELMGQTTVMHHLRLVHINCKAVNPMQPSTKPFTLRNCVVLANQRCAEWEVTLWSHVVQDFFAILSSL